MLFFHCALPSRIGWLRVLRDVAVVLPQELGLQFTVQRMLLQLQTSRMFFRPRVTITIGSVKASMLTTSGASCRAP